MTFANVTKSKVTADEPKNIPVQEPINNLSWIMRQLQDKSFNKLIEEEKRRAFEDEVDLNVQPGLKVKLVSWIRFHRIYQSGRMCVRYLRSPAGPVILVMRPGEIVEEGISRDIQTMQGEQNAPEIIKQLLEPFISLEKTSAYAVMFCDGVNWGLVDCLNPKASETLTKPPSAISSVAERQSQQDGRQPEQLAEPQFPEQHAEENSVERATSDPRQIIPTKEPLISEEFSSFSPSGPAKISPRSEANPTDVISNDQFILPDDFPQSDTKRNLPDLVDPQFVKNPSTLADPGLDVFSNFGDSSTIGTSVGAEKTPRQETEENEPTTPPEATPPDFPANHLENCSQSNRSIDIENHERVVEGELFLN